MNPIINFLIDGLLSLVMVMVGLGVFLVFGFVPVDFGVWFFGCGLLLFLGWFLLGRVHLYLFGCGLVFRVCWV